MWTIMWLVTRIGFPVSVPFADRIRAHYEDVLNSIVLAAVLPCCFDLSHHHYSPILSSL